MKKVLQTLSHYRILEKIGAGGMGEVYKAHDERLDRDVAIKVLPSGTLTDEQARKRFRKEALALSKLNHPNIATVHDFDTQDGVDFIVMEYVEGASLAEKVKTGPLPEKEISELGAQIADALEEAHERGIVHRDLKPGNIAVTPKGRAKVLDFGLARMLRPVSDEATTAALTEGLAVAGTLPYMAPEELRGERADHRSDLYSFGVVLYEMATGRRPFEHTLSTALADAIIHKPPEPPSSHNRKVSPGLEAIIIKALDKDPAHRYQSAREMRVDLERLSVPVSVAVPKRKPHRAGQWLWAAACVVAVMAVLFALNVGGFRDRLNGGPSAPRIESIAVLPLENLSGDLEQEYFSDGMTEALIANLAKIQALRVISRTSVMQYRDARKPLPEIARELNVEAVVEGSVQRVGEKVRITAQLLHAPTDEHVWTQTFDRDVNDVLTLQSDLALAIAREIQVKLEQEERVRLAASKSVDPEAYDFYLRAQHARSEPTVESIEEAIRNLKRAIEADPGFAPAYAALADLYDWRGEWTDPGEAHADAKTAAMKALELDESLGEAHSALGLVKASEWNWQGAEMEMRRGIELSPNNVLAREAYMRLLTFLGRFSEALNEAQIVLQLDPLAPLSRRYLGWLYYYARRHDESINELKKLPELRTRGDPEFMAWPLVYLAMNYTATNRFEDAVATCDKIRSLVPPGKSDFEDSTIAYVLAKVGQQREGRNILHDWKARAEHEHVDSFLAATVCVGLGDQDEAFDWLTTGVERREISMKLLKVEPAFDPLRSDPRFQDLLRRMNFPE